MHNFGFALQGGLQVLVVGLLLGAGLPAAFALGVRALAYASPRGGVVADGKTYPLGKVFAVLCFALVVLGVVLGIAVIVSGGTGKEFGLGQLFGFGG